MTESDPNNRRTVAAYERYASRYAAAVSPQPSARAELALRRFVACLPAGGRLLEVGSGPGWDADFVESLGPNVHRTDATAAFRRLQQARGKRVDAFDVLVDPVPGVYCGVMLLCVLQHFEREQADAVLRTLASTLALGGALLLSHPVGEDAIWEHGESGDYRVVRWTVAALDPRLASAGFTIIWQAADDPADVNEPWRTLLAIRQGEP